MQHMGKFAGGFRFAQGQGMEDAYSQLFEFCRGTHVPAHQGELACKKKSHSLLFCIVMKTVPAFMLIKDAQGAIS